MEHGPSHWSALVEPRSEIAPKLWPRRCGSDRLLDTASWRACDPNGRAGGQQVGGGVHYEAVAAAEGQALPARSRQSYHGSAELKLSPGLLTSNGVSCGTVGSTLTCKVPSLALYLSIGMTMPPCMGTVVRVAAPAERRTGRHTTLAARKTLWENLIFIIVTFTFSLAG